MITLGEPSFFDPLEGAETIGASEEGRPIEACVFGRGAKRVSLIAGAHADEPVGPATLRALARQHAELGPLLDEFTFVVVPDINPDGAARNRSWVERWPDRAAFEERVVRERPGRDLEFGFPDMRPENRAVAAFLRAHAPFVLHMSLHGMGVADGALLLIEKTWIDRTGSLREQYAAALAAAGLALLDRDRKGEKGFHYIGPGFWTAPEGTAMRAHFEGLGDPETAALFHQSSMEFVRALGGDPLCLVTEVPLFSAGQAVDLRAAMALQLRALELGLAAAARG